MTLRTPSHPDAEEMPDIGDIYAHHGAARQWRVTGIMECGPRTYAVLCDVDDPARSVIIAIADLRASGPFTRVPCQ